MTFILLFLAGVIAYVISTLSGGGGAIIMLPIVGFYLSPQVVAPVVNLGNMIGRPARIILFWKDIQWDIVKFYVPSAILGAIVGGFIFIQLNSSWIQIALGLFLLSTPFQFKMGKKKYSFKMKKVYFIPLGFLVSLIATLFGATGAVLNPFYLNMGLIKEKMIATKTANSFIAGIAQIGSYAFLGVLNQELWVWGLVIGLGAIVGNIIGKKLLNQMSELNFRRGVLIIMVISGSMMLYNGLF
ncbi:MAG: sulfite exporter TauE/SafE family protein [Bacteroidetes bacterium]|nr:MAG: sulfite exporter TauE/SafE family protein [Bacteroidota bacterium]MBL1144323.1 sulfite exporter TauE/SafE family protein [Bacteroidota bacterium]MCB0801601.1 sulfite exporter TauE/SafE family protein [Flavobacteriales bacterium]NOG57119.1 sulfite exporter TauE/SafE family protein [Bacteroidota bacterium]